MEQFRKTSILGFYGVAPNVEILVQDITQPLDRLAFVLLAEPGEGHFKVGIRIRDTEGKDVVRVAGEAEMVVPTPPRRVNLTFGVSHVKFPAAGEYKLALIVDGEVRYEESFRVIQGKPEDFA